MKRIIGIIVAAAAVTLATACQDGVTTQTSGGSSVSNPATVAVPGSAQPPVTQQSPGVTQPAGDNAPATATATATATAGNGKCVDLKSAVVTAALGTLGAGVGGDGFYADSGTDASVGACPAILWVLAGTPHGTASSPWHVMLFNHAGYLGTATKKSTAYTQVVGSSDRSVEVQYRWLTGKDASCCPSGGPVIVTLTLGADDRSVTPDRDFPTEVTDPSSASSPPVCPVTKAVLLEALRGTDIGSRLATPIELEDRIDCAGEWAMAHTGTHDNTVNRAQVLFHYVAADGGWKPVGLGSALHCTETGVPADVADKICG